MTGDLLYDAVGNLTTIGDATANQNHTYTYDHLDRLTTWSVTGANPTSENYSYDTIGNITSKAGASYTYPAGGQPRPHAPTVVGGQSYSYDPNGNLLSGGGRTLTWDYDNKPTSVTPAGGSIFTAESYQYGADGERIKKTVGNVTTHYFGLLEEEVNAGTGVTTRRLQYKWSGSVIAQREKVGAGVETVVYLSGDHLGSVSVATNATGGYVNGSPQQQQQLFDPWGKIRSGTLTSTTTLNYTGQKLDATGLLFYNARYYDPNIAKFTSPDNIVPKIQAPPSLNRYTYVDNNPVKFNDPTGHCKGTPNNRGDDADCWKAYDDLQKGAYGKLGYVADLHTMEKDILEGLLGWISRGARFISGVRDWTAAALTNAVKALNQIEYAFSRKFTEPGAASYAVDKALFGNGARELIFVAAGRSSVPGRGAENQRGSNVIEFYDNVWKHKGIG
jgi:RHS repeat-associated protein